MTRIVAHKTDAVTLGVMDKNLAVHEQLQQVTFDDIHGTRHTVQAHRDGPFSTPEDIVAAFYDGTLHVFKDHETAAVFEEDRGDHETAKRLRELGGTVNPQTQGRGEGGY